MTLHQDLSRVRREAACHCLEVFARTYLQHHFRLPTSSMHRELFSLFEGATEKRNARLAIAAPRGHAKTTLLIAYILWSICYERENYILFVSTTAEQPEQHLSAVKSELESNPLLLEDFPEAVEPPGIKPSSPRWRRRDFLTRNGVKVVALGAGQRIRGRKHNEHRPSLIAVDDVESEADAFSADQRETKRQWFQRALMKAGTTPRTNILVLGTLLHYDSLLSFLMGPDSPGWTSRKYQAVLSWAERTELWDQWERVFTSDLEFEGHSGLDAARAFYEANQAEMLEGAAVLWPECESYLRLMELRLTGGRASFDSEKQNEPVDLANCFLDPGKVRYWDDEFASVDELLLHFRGQGSVVGACDPSLGRVGRNRDDTAIVVLFQHRETGLLYVLEADIRKRAPLETIEAILAFHQRYRFQTFAIETNQFQEFLKTELERQSKVRALNVPVIGVHHSADKLGRIQSLEPLITTGILRFSRQHRSLLDQLRQFPKAAHDDGLDALEMAVKVKRPVLFFPGYLDMKTMRIVLT